MPHKGFRHTWAIKGQGGAGRILALALLALLFILVGACGGDDSAERFRLRFCYNLCRRGSFGSRLCRSCRGNGSGDDGGVVRRHGHE